MEKARKIKENEVFMRKLALPDEILLSIQQPARYIGGEVNMCVKDPKDVDIRFAMCFPNVYEINHKNKKKDKIMCYYPSQNTK